MANKSIDLRREYFAVNSDGCSEFDWFLEKLGIANPEPISEITIEVETDDIENIYDDESREMDLRKSDAGLVAKLLPAR